MENSLNYKGINSPANTIGEVRNVASTSDSPSLIRDAVTSLEEQFKALHQSISLLGNRLDTALQSVPPSVAAPTEPGRPCGSSHLHCRLLGLSDDVMAAIDRVADLTRRVEI